MAWLDRLIGAKAPEQASEEVPEESAQESGTDTGSPPDPGVEELARLREQVNAERTQRAQAEERFRALQNQFSQVIDTIQSRTASPAPLPPSPPEEPPDTSDPAALAAYVQRTVDSRLGPARREVAQMIEQTSTAQVAQVVDLRRAAFYNELKASQMEDLVPEIEQYIRDNGITLHMLSAPRAFQTIASTIVGEKLLNNPSRFSPSSPGVPASTGGRSPSGSRVQRPSSEFRRVAEEAGVDIDEEEFEFLNSGPVTSKAWNEFQKKRSNGGR